jgi:hypothetical protein
MRPNFELITELQTLTRRDFPLADPSLLAPVGTNPIVDGEFLELDANYKLSRSGGIGQVGGAKESATPLLFPVHTERGRYDTQAIGKVNVLFLGMYEAETALATAGGLSIGDPLTVQEIGSPAKRGLAKAAAGSGVTVVGYVSRLPADGRVRFVHFGNVLT